MSNTFVQGNGTTASSGTVASLGLAYPGNVASGNLLVVCVRHGTDGTISSITDTIGNNWTLVYDNEDALSGAYSAWAWTFSSASAANTVTVHFSPSTAAQMAIAEYSGVNNLQAAPAANGSTTGTTATSNAATAISGDLQLGFFDLNSGGTATAGSGYTIREIGSVSGNNFVVIEDNLNSAGGSVTAAVSGFTSGAWQAGIGIFFNGYLITGNAGIAGATVSYTGTASGSVTADGGGNYSIRVSSNGSYTITPSFPGETFSPTNANETVSGSNIAGVNFIASIAPTIGVWQYKELVITPVSSDTPGQANVLYEGNAQILSGTVFKMWFGTANGVCYAESTDGFNWTRYGSNPIIVPSGSKNAGWTGYPKIFKNGSTYYAYVVNGDFKSMSSWTSTDGVTFTEQSSNSLSGWGVGTSFVGQLAVLGQSSGTWYGYYTGWTGSTYAIGYATSSDLITWAGYASNPVITSGQPSNFTFQKVGSLYYGWSQVVQAGIPAYGGGNGLPSDISRYVSSSLTGPWTGPLATSTVYRTVSANGVGLTLGQVADPCIIQANGQTWLFATVTPTGNGAPSNYQIAAYTSSLTVAQLVQTYEGVVAVPSPSSYGFTSALNQLAADSGFTSGNWTTFTAATGWGAPTFGSGYAEGTTSDVRGTAYYSGGSISWPNDQWVSVTLKTNANSTSGTSAGVRLNTSGVATGYFATIYGAALGSGSVILYVQKFVNNVLTQLFVSTSGEWPWAATDVLTISAVGSTISVYQNANLLYTTTDTDIASGAPGFSCYGDGAGSNSAISAFAAGDFAATIGGNVGIAGATVSDGTNTATTDANGTYILSPEHGMVTVTPTLAGHTFVPSSRNETAAGIDITDVNFSLPGGGSWLQAFRNFANKKGGLTS